MYERTIGDYGGPYIDAKPLKNPETQLAAARGNRVFEDTAQMTRSSSRAWVSFKTNTSTDPPPIDVSHSSQWGSGDAQKPTVDRTAAGKYIVTYSTNFVDALGVSEDVNFRFGMAGVISDDDDVNHAKIRAIAANFVTVSVLDDTGAPSDLGGTARVILELR